MYTKSGFLLGRILGLDGGVAGNVLTSLCGLVFLKNAQRCARMLYKMRILNASGIVAHAVVGSNSPRPMRPIEICCVMGFQYLGVWLWQKTARLYVENNIYSLADPPNALVLCLYNERPMTQAIMDAEMPDYVSTYDPIVLF